MSIITSDLYDCYENIIGLSRTECTCEDPKGDFELSYNTSLSGIYLDELAPINMIIGLEGCEKDVWEILNRARENGVKDFVSDAFQVLMKRRKLRQNAWSGILGRRKQTKDRSIQTTYAGVQMFCKSVKSGTVKITKIYTLFNFTGNVTVTVYNNFNENLGSYLLNTVADTLTENDITDLELPLFTQWADNLTYYFTYTLGANQPRDNTLDCSNCNQNMNAPSFIPNRPHFHRSQTETHGWANYLQVGGFETNELEFEENSPGASCYMNGLVFDLELKCNIHELFCIDALDFRTDPLALSIAHAIRIKAAILLANDIFTSKLNYWNMINREYLANEQKQWEETYKDMLEHIAKKVPLTRNDCWTCDDDDIIMRKMIPA